MSIEDPGAGRADRENPLNGLVTPVGPITLSTVGAVACGIQLIFSCLIRRDDHLGDLFTFPIIICMGVAAYDGISQRWSWGFAFAGFATMFAMLPLSFRMEGFYYDHGLCITIGAVHILGAILGVVIWLAGLMTLKNPAAERSDLTSDRTPLGD